MEIHRGSSERRHVVRLTRAPGARSSDSVLRFRIQRARDSIGMTTNQQVIHTVVNEARGKDASLSSRPPRP
jgi:hypothetical protein